MRSSRRRSWILGACVTLGASGVVGQVLLWRELLTLYQGNELTTGIILANGLLAEALGAAFGARRPGARQPALRVFALLTACFCIALPLSMSATRLLRGWLGLAMGQPVGPVFTTLTSLLLLLPVAFFHGALFPVAGRLYRETGASGPGAAVGGLYVWESLGTLLGGLLLLGHFLAGGQGFRLVALLWVANGLVLASGSAAPGTPAMRRLRAAGLAGLAAASWAVLAAGADRLHDWTRMRRHAPFEVLASASSPHGNWTVLDSDGQYLFVLDGQPIYLVPVPDRSEVEIAAHIPLLLHERPERVCVLSGGAGGLLDEILKHPSIAAVDVTELDPALLSLFDRFPTALTRREFEDPRVRLHALDGRRFIQEPGPRYDIVWVGVAEPSSLHANRYFTREFFQAVHRRLAPDGMVVVGLPGRMAYAPVDLRRLQASLLETLQDVFAQVRLLPGEGRFLFLASPAVRLDDAREDDLARAVMERGLEDAVGMPWHLEQRLHAGWLEWADETFQDKTGEVNRDLRPMALFHLLSYQQSAHMPRTAAFLRALHRHRVWVAALGLALLFGVRRFGRRRRAPPDGAGPVLAQVATTGFAGMLLDLLVIFAFQSALGHLHIWIGLLVAVFMAGAAGAAAVATRWAQDARRVPAALRMCDLLLCAFCACLPLLLGLAGRLAARSPAAAIAGFLAINFAAGCLTGGLFPIAAARRGRQQEVGRAAGVLQAADLAGGWVAGLVGATLLLPLGGLVGAVATILALKALIHVPVRASVKHQQGRE